jgi:alpha-ribazole phosphatase/probable phosphoglycerate mutase
MHHLITMRASTLVFVRHAHVADNDAAEGARLCGWFDSPLSRRGWTQVERLCARLEQAPRPAALYTSPLRRALSTAHVIGSRLGLPLRPLDLLREIHCGRLEGVPLVEVQRRYPCLWHANLRQTDDGFHWPGGESYRDFRRRILRAVVGIAAAHPGEQVMIITHAGVIGQVLGALHGIRAARWEPFRPSNASLTVVDWVDTTGQVRTFDDHDHLGQAGLAPQDVSPLNRTRVVAHRLDLPMGR